MKKERIERLKYYKSLLIECKKIQLHYLLSEQTENKLPTYIGKEKVLILK